MTSVTPRKNWKKAAAIVLGALLVALVALAVVARPFLFPKHYDVVSIKTLPAYQDRARLERAWALPVAATYRQGLVFQPNGSFCGPTSIADVLRSLGTPSATPAAVLEGTGFCETGICLGGLTLDQLAEIARAKLHKRVTVLRDLSLAQFREHLAHANDTSRRYTINFDRGPLFGTAGGHHSPLGGYLADEDLVLVLDVNAKYKPWLVPTARLYEAMNTVDGSSGKKRGLLLIE